MPETTTKRGDSAAGKFTPEERAAMQERAKELKAESRRTSKAGKKDGLADLKAKIADMPESDRIMAERFHEIVMEVAPDLTPKTWYGMPAYANKDGKLICFFQAADKFKARYATFGFDENAKLDEGSMWPTSWALQKLTEENAKAIAALVKKAVG